MNRYEKIRKIGEGAFGKAYLMKEKSSGSQVVVKETCLSKLPPKERDDARRETAVLAQLQHPAIVTYHDSFEEFGNLYIVMDYCDGGDLANKINGQHGRLFAEDEILDWIVQLCLAIKHIHDRNILHRDIKCQNIFLTRAGQIKLGDFGIAKILDSTVQLSHTLIGTPYYFSPEICMGKSYNHKSDIWSLGCVFYELATLRHAFDGNNLRAVMQKIQSATPPPISRTYSPDLTLFISSILKKNQRDRPSVSTLLQRPIVSKRIHKFLSEEQYASEFSHTVLHGERLMKKLPLGGGAGRGVNARRPQSAQVQQPRANLGMAQAAAAAAAGNPPTPAQRPSTAAEGNRPNPGGPRNRIGGDEEAAAAVRVLPNFQDSDSSRDQAALNRLPRQEPQPMPRPAVPNVPVFRAMPFPSASRGGDRGDYRSYLEFLRQLDIRRHQAPPPDPAAILAPQPMARPQPAAQAAVPSSARPASAAQHGRINVVNAGLARQLVQNQPTPQNNNKRPSSANVAAAGVDNKRPAPARPMGRNNIPPSGANNNNKRPVSRDQVVYDRLQRVRQSNVRNRAVPNGQRQPLMRPPSAGGYRQNVARQVSADRARQVPVQQPQPQQQQQQQQQQQVPVQSNQMSGLTDALRIVQVPGIPPSPRVPASVTPAVVPRLTDALKAVTPRQPTEPTAPKATVDNNNAALPIDQEKLKKLRHAELQKANANPPIIIGDRPFWLPNQSISEDLNSLTPEMTGSKMVATVEKQPQQARRRQWTDKPKEEPVVAKSTDSSEGTFVMSKSAVKQQRPAWTNHSPVLASNSPLLSTKDSSSVVVKLATGQFDVDDFKLLRTCSLPSLAGDSSPASTVSTLEIERTSIPSSRGQAASSVSELNHTLGLSRSTSDLLLQFVSPSLDIDEPDTLKLEESSTKVGAAVVAPPKTDVKLAWTKFDLSKPSPASRDVKRQSTGSNNDRHRRQRKKSDSSVQSSLVALTVDEDIDVDSVSRSMLNILASDTLLPQENSSEPREPAKTSSPKIIPNKAEPMRTIMEQLTMQTNSMTSSISSIDGGDAIGSNSDISKIIEKLERIHGTDSPVLQGDSATLKASSVIDALEDHGLLDTMSVIRLDNKP